jgi:hypothetical protein
MRHGAGPEPRVERRPFSQIEPALADDAIAPGAGDINDGAAGDQCLERDLESDLETAGALDVDAVKHLRVIETEAVDCIVDRKPGDPAQGPPSARVAL